MTAKEYLKQYEQLNKRALRFKAEYERETELIDSVRSTLGGDGMPHGSGISKSVEDRAIRLSDKFLKWKQAELDAIEKRQQIFEMIVDISGVEGDILLERYVNLRQWEEICIIVHYTWSSTHRAHRRALDIVQKRIDNIGIERH